MKDPCFSDMNMNRIIRLPIQQRCCGNVEHNALHPQPRLKTSNQRVNNANKRVDEAVLPMRILTLSVKADFLLALLHVHVIVSHRRRDAPIAARSMFSHLRLDNPRRRQLHVQSPAPSPSLLCHQSTTFLLKYMQGTIRQPGQIGRGLQGIKSV